MLRAQLWYAAEPLEATRRLDEPIWPRDMLQKVTNAVPADASRAMYALERAVACSTAGTADRPLVVVEGVEVEALSPGDIRPLLDRIILGEYPDEGLSAMLEAGVLDHMLPEVKALVGFGDGEWRHKDVWKHTLQVVRQSVCRLEVRWAALFHDIGKVRTRSVDENGEVHFLGHAEVGARMFDGLERRLGLFRGESSLRKSVRFLVLHHLRASQYDSRWTDSAVRRFAREVGANLDNLLCLSRADITTKRPEKKRRGIALIDELGTRIGALAIEDAKRPPLPKGVGSALMEAFGLPPSRLVGEVKRVLESAVESGELEPFHDSDYYVAFVAQNRERFHIV